jgi:integrase
MDESVEQRLENASPKELRTLATELLRGKHPELLRQPEAELGAGKGDGGTSSEPPAPVDLQTETNPDRVREEARRIDRALAAALKRAGLDHVSWHDLRHAHVSRLFAVGHDPMSIAARIGDSIQTVLATYAHEYDAARRRQDESDKLAALYDHGNAMETRGNNAGQQTASGDPPDLALHRAIRHKAQ